MAFDRRPCCAFTDSQRCLAACLMRGSLVVFAHISHRLYSVLVGTASYRMPLNLPLVGRLGRNAKLLDDLVATPNAVWLVTMTGARRGSPVGPVLMAVEPPFRARRIKNRDQFPIRSRFS